MGDLYAKHYMNKTRDNKTNKSKNWSTGRNKT